METLQSVILGIIQGITEFIPVSSTAHLLVIPWFFSWQDQGLPFTVALHLGSLIAIVHCFRQEIASIARGFFRCVANRSFQGNRHGRTGFYMIIATVPAVIAGTLFEHYVSGVLRHPVFASFFLAGFGLLLYAADRRTDLEKTLDDMDFSDALFFGIAQAFAVFPGASRSGVTITGGLFRNYKRDEAARFSFLLAIPVISAAVVFQISHVEYADMVSGSFILGIAASFLSSLLAIRFLLDYVKKRSFAVFVIYRISLAAVIVIMYSSGFGS